MCRISEVCAYRYMQYGLAIRWSFQPSHHQYYCWHCSDSQILHYSSAMTSTGSASSASGSTAPLPPPPMPLCYSMLCNYDGIHQCRICPRQALHPHCMTVRSLHHMCSIEGHEGANIHNDCTDPTDIARQYIAGCTHGVCISTHSTAHIPPDYRGMRHTLQPPAVWRRLRDHL